MRTYEVDVLTSKIDGFCHFSYVFTMAFVWLLENPEEFTHAARKADIKKGSAILRSSSTVITQREEVKLETVDGQKNRPSAIQMIPPAPPKFNVAAGSLQRCLDFEFARSRRNFRTTVFNIELGGIRGYLSGGPIFLSIYRWEVYFKHVAHWTSCYLTPNAEAQGERERETHNTTQHTRTRQQEFK